MSEIRVLIKIGGEVHEKTLVGLDDEAFENLRRGTQPCMSISVSQGGYQPQAGHADPRPAQDDDSFLDEHLRGARARARHAVDEAASLRGRVAELISDLERTGEKALDLEDERDRLANETMSLSTEIGELHKENARLQARVSGMAEEAAAVRGRVAEIVRDMDKPHRTGSITTLREWGDRLMRALGNAS